MLMELPDPPLDEIREILSDIRRDDMRASEVVRQVRAMMASGETHMAALHPGELAKGVVGSATPPPLASRSLEFRLEQSLLPPPLVSSRSTHASKNASPNLWTCSPTGATPGTPDTRSPR